MCAEERRADIGRRSRIWEGGRNTKTPVDIYEVRELRKIAGDSGWKWPKKWVWRPKTVRDAWRKKMNRKIRKKREDSKRRGPLVMRGWRS